MHTEEIAALEALACDYGFGFNTILSNDAERTIIKHTRASELEEDNHGG